MKEFELNFLAYARSSIEKRPKRDRNPDITFSHNSKSGGNHFSGDYDGQTIDERRVYRHHLGFRAADDGYPTQVERLNRSYPGIMVLSVIDPPTSMGKPPVPWKKGRMNHPGQAGKLPVPSFRTTDDG
ncbi:hypothetical protein BHM03_00014070 [Ensete ventricosum]|uniref:Uncharacterized protein n=1 Tax=Ensete ventricosum TaxID=4639 RepID=A0A445ME15_ENSVE|nr:hypothetical protein BHM03_00014070 [Ensete ventricosum]